MTSPTSKGELPAFEIEPANRTLQALNRAALAIASELDIEKVLQLIVDSARDLAGSKYGALAVGDWREVNAPDVQRFVTSGLSNHEISNIEHWPQGMGLLGAVIHDQETIRVDAVDSDARFLGFPEGHPVMHSFLGAPILGANETFGNLYLADKVDGTSFTDTDQQLIEMLAAHAAVAIQNARLYSQVERLAILEERSRIGMDLHDGVIQSIYAVGLTLESARLSLPPGAEESDALLDTAVGGLNEAIRDIRNFILDLRPRRFPGEIHLGMQQLVREFQANTMVPVELTIPERISELPLPLARAIYLTTQEALANIARHARAKGVSVSLICTDNDVDLSVTDDGRGFDPEAETVRIGHGLANMQARAEGLNGSFVLRSLPGQGTSVVVKLPR
ncbi:MAG: GAF domain-containing sensor histidine kinase [Chloroflexota bacterium]